MQRRLTCSICGLMALLFPLTALAQDFQSMIKACDDGIHFYMEQNYSSRTQLVYTCPVSEVQSSKDAVNFMFSWKEGLTDGYGKGMSDGPLIGGTLLEGLADRWKVEQNERLQADADKIARGLLNLANVPGHRGFVARGICADDGRTICANTSIDQITHWVHGLWRYSTSGMGRKSYVKEYKKRLVDVAKYIEQRMTPENQYNIGMADGTVPDSRGICYMYGDHLWPHEAPRLPMVYIAAYMMTGDEHWKDMYESVVDWALERTLDLRGMTEQEIGGRMPCYSLYQAMCALELILSYENDTERTQQILKAMNLFSKTARSRSVDADPANPPYGMTWDGELVLTELMDPEFIWGGLNERFLLESVGREDLMQGGWCRAAHIYAALWKFISSRSVR